MSEVRNTLLKEGAARKSGEFFKGRKKETERSS
jgi:hypothetical protein